MNIGKRKLSGTTTILLVALLAVSTVLGALTILYTLNVPATWNVRVATGLQLTYPNGTTVTAISFTVDPLGSQTQNFILKNLANHPVNVTDNIPDSTSLYQFTTTFLNSTALSQNIIAQSGSYAFSIMLTDLGMDSSATYSGNFQYNIASGFNLGSSSFSVTTVNYASDTSQYFGFVSDNFNASSYPLGSTVLYSFTTEDINQTYEIQGLSYKLELWNTTSLVSTLADGLVVAYYQDSTHYGTFGNGTHMTDVPLMPNQNMTIWNSFPAPNTPGTYHLLLTYQSHNAAPVVPPTYPISWTTQVNIQNGYIMVSPGPTITGATLTGQQGTISFTVGGYYSTTVSYDYSITVLDSNSNLISTIASGSDHITALKNYSFDFTMTQGSALTMVVAFTNDRQG